MSRPYTRTKRLCVARAKNGQRRSKRVDIWLSPNEVSLLDRLADTMRPFTGNVPASRSLICRKALEVLAHHLKIGGHVEMYRDKLYLQHAHMADSKAGGAKEAA